MQRLLKIIYLSNSIYWAQCNLETLTTVWRNNGKGTTKSNLMGLYWAGKEDRNQNTIVFNVGFTPEQINIILQAFVSHLVGPKTPA